MKLKDKVAVITGAGRGIGRAIAREFAREGARTLIAEQDESTGPAVAEEITAGGGEARFQRCDVTREEDVAAAIEAASEAFGRIDLMVNNAGVSQRDWETTIAVNLSGVYHGCRLAAERMAAQG
ncbi:MAG: SDR family NAD(P)-dependent oxidoreductase, partial [Dehalococcoidia bacterium]|nr:SDR family NAD(P)-dependent oxidoreductase [Dehalococcoidia bacterium]